MKELVKVCNFNKSYKGKDVVKNISFNVMEGDILGFLGPNGAGKSTTIRMLTGIASDYSGKLFYCGKEMNNNREEMKKELGLVPQDIALYSDLSAYNNVKFFCGLYGHKGKDLEDKIKEALEFVALWDRRNDKIDTFSGGMQRRLNIACAIAHSPKLLILDEPTVGIDPQSRNYILEALKILNKRGTTIIYVSHYMEEISAICNRIIILDKGEIRLNTYKEELINKYNSSLEDIFLKITGTKLRDEEE